MASPESPPRSGRKHQIVEVVLRLVADKGVEAVTARRVADQIGVTQPAVFRHFANKEEMWLAVMDWLQESLESIVASPRHNDPMEELRRIFVAHGALIRARPAVAKIVFSDQLRLAYPSLKSRFAMIHRDYSARLDELIQEALPGANDRSAVIATFLALVQGYAFQTAVAETAPDSDRLPETMFEFFIHGTRVAIAEGSLGSTSEPHPPNRVRATGTRARK